jgi:hypothetical protein
MKKKARVADTQKSALGLANTLDDLLARIRAHLSASGDLSRQQVIKRTADLGWAANVVAHSLAKERIRVRLLDLIENQARFEQHLNQGTQITPGRKATLRTLRNRLIRYAREFGVVHEELALKDEWNEILAAVKGVQGGPAIVKAAMQRGLRPSEFSDADLNRWGDERKRANCTYVYVQLAQTYFRAAIRSSGLTAKLPCCNCDCRTHPPYRVKIADFPPKLQKQLKGVFQCVSEHRQEQVRMSR